MIDVDQSDIVFTSVFWKRFLKIENEALLSSISERIDIIENEYTILKIAIRQSMKFIAIKIDFHVLVNIVFLGWIWLCLTGNQEDICILKSV